MRILRPLVLFSICALSAFGCTRKVDSQASIQLDFSGLAKGVNAQDSNFILKFVAINAYDATTNADVASMSIHASRNSNDDIKPIDPLLPPIELPSGVKLVVQVLAVVENASGSSQFWYEDATETFKSGLQKLDIQVKQVGPANVGDGQISGRYVKSGGGGPTGRAKVYFKVPNKPDRKKMLIENNLEMFSGWFRFFALEGASLEYVDPEGNPLFGGPVNVDTPSLSAGQSSFLVYTPAFYNSHGPNSTIRRLNEPAKALYGFFGPGVTAEKVCYSTLPSSVSYAYADATSNDYIAWSGAAVDSTSAHVSQGGYGVSPAPGDLCQASGARFVNYISFNDQAATSHDSALGFKGPFVIPYDSANPTNSEILTVDNDGTNMTISWTYLPGVQTDGPVKGIDGARLYVRAEDPNNPGESRDYRTGDDMVKCGILDRSGQGFQPFTFLGDVPATADVEAVSNPISLSSLNASLVSAIDQGFATLIACPYFLDKDNNPVFYQSAAVNYPHGGGVGGEPATKIGLASGNPVLNLGTCSEMDVVLQSATNHESDPMLNTSLVQINITGSNEISFKEFCPAGAAVTEVFVDPGFSRTRVGLSAGTEGVYTFTLTDATAALSPYSGSLTIAPYGAVTHLQFADSSGNPIVGILNGACTPLKLIGKDSSMTNRSFYADHAIALSASSGAFYNNPTCSASPITSISSGLGYATNIFYFKSTTNGWAALNANVANYQPGVASYSLSGTASAPVGIAGQPAFLTVTPGPMVNGVCTAISVIVRDVTNAPVNVSQPMEISLDGFQGGAYSTATCTPGSEAPSQGTVAAGASSATIYVLPFQSGNQMVSAWAQNASGMTNLFGSTNFMVSLAVPNLTVTEINRNEFANNNVFVAWNPPTNLADTNYFRVWISTDGSTSLDINWPSDLCWTNVSPSMNQALVSPCPVLVDAGMKFVKIVAIDFNGQPIPSSLQVHQMLLYHNLSSSRVLSLGNGNSVDLLTLSGGFGPAESPGGTVDCAMDGSITGDATLVNCTYTGPSSGSFSDTIILHTNYGGIQHFEYVRFTQ